MPSNKPRLPQIDSTRTVAAGVALVQLLADSGPDEGGLGYFFRAQPEGDVGIDAHLEVVDHETGSFTGRIVGLQIKSGRSYFRAKSGEGWAVRVSPAKIEYWRNYSVPVLLVLADTATGSAYWTVVSGAEFPLTGKSHKVLVPRWQRFDASSAVAIRVIAAKAPADLAQQLELNRRLEADEQAARQALEGAATTEDLRSAAQGAIAVAGALRQAGRPRDAAVMWRQGIRVIIKAGDTEHALRSLTELLAWLVRDLREAGFAIMIRRDALAGGEPLPDLLSHSSVSETVQLALEAVTAEAEAACGVRKPAADLASRLDDSQALDRARLRVAVALAAEDHEAAGAAYVQLARVSPPETAPSALLRGHLHAGLAGDAAAAAQRAAEVSTDAGATVEQALVLGWLHASQGDLVIASQDFLVASEAAIAADDPYRALRALRNAQRCERLAGIQSFDADAPWRRARKIEPLAKARAGDRVTHDRFVSRIDTALERGELREAYLLVKAAAYYAWEDLDPAAYEDLELRYATLMRAAASESPSPDLLMEAVRATAESYPLLDSRESKSAAGPLLDLLRERLTPEFATLLWEALDDGAKTGNRLSGSLMLAAKLADRWEFPDRDVRVAALICRGLAAGVGMRGDGPALKALDLILALEPPLEGAEAAAVRDALMPLLEQVRWDRRADLLNAIAVTAAAGAMPDDGGRALLDVLLRFESRAFEYDDGPQWLGALAMLHRQASGEPRQEIADLLRERAIVAKGSSKAGWHVAERAIAGGIELPDELADRYLDEMKGLLTALRAQSLKAGGLGFGARHNAALTLWAAPRASPASRDGALLAAIDFLLYPEHLLHERVGWLPFIARLARSAPALLPNAIEALLVVSRGEVQPVGEFDAFTTPFASFRITGHTPEQMKAEAVQWLATLIPAADASHQAIIVGALKAAAGHSEPELREAAVGGAARALRQPEGSGSVSASLRSDVLLPLTSDPVPRIALAAYRALNPG